MRSAPIILVPGFWLGGWAWDEVAGYLRDDGFDVTALTLPGMESMDADRSSIGFKDHVDAIVRAIESKDEPVVLAVHSATGITGYAASDVVPERIAAMVYVDSAPGIAPQDPNFTDAEKPLDWAALSEEENLDGVSEEQQATFRERGVPVPGGVLRDGYPLTNDARKDIPSTLICTAFTAADYQKYAAQEPVMSWLAGVRELRNATWVDMPTSHWPMFSKPRELADQIAQVARTASNPVTA
jgi:pimeloyl-ACP methyl ester carboxylesterase